METKQITIFIDELIANTAEKILDDLGLDIQMGVNIFLKRIIKEGGINFLLQNKATTIEQHNINTELNMPSKSNTNENINKGTSINIKNSYATSRNNNEITEEMRDYIWKQFIENKNLSYSEYQILAREVNLKTGMNQGSAYIYFVILSCFMEGKFNTRTMKYADLYYYVKRILQDCTKSEFESTLKSLEQSIPYWSEHLQGNFAVKVQKLVNQYKSLLSNIKDDNPKTHNIFTKSCFEEYLINMGYSQFTPSGAPSTVYDYLKRIDKVCTIEKIDWIDIPERIEQLIGEYDIGGIKESIGAESHNAVISALKQAYKCIKENN